MVIISFFFKKRHSGNEVVLLPEIVLGRLLHYNFFPVSKIHSPALHVHLM